MDIAAIVKTLTEMGGAWPIAAIFLVLYVFERRQTIKNADKLEKIIESTTKTTTEFRAILKVVADTNLLTHARRDRGKD